MTPTSIFLIVVGIIVILGSNFSNRFWIFLGKLFCVDTSGPEFDGPEDHDDYD
jgi:hypothetical protein